MLAFGCSPAPAQEPGTTRVLYESWTAQQGAPQAITALAHTSDGILWVAGAGGLFRFDGARFEPFHAVSGDLLLSNNIYSLLAPSSGGLWVGYTYGGFSFINNGVVKTYGGEIADQTGSVTSFAEGPHHDLWAATSNGPWRLEGSTWRRAEAWNRPTHFLFIGFDRSGTLWALDNRTLYYLVPGAKQFQIADVSREVLDPYTNFTLDADRYVVTRPNHQDHEVSALPILRTGTHQMLDRNNGLWVWEHNWNHVLRFRPADKALSDVRNMPDASDSETFRVDVTMNSRFVDHEGDVWLGGDKALYRFYNTPVIEQKTPAPFGDFAISPEDGSGVWITSWSDPRLVRIANGKTEILHAPAPEMGWALVYTAPDKTVWFGGKHHVWHFVNEKFVRVEVPHEIADQTQYLQAIAPDRSGGLWFSFGRHGLYRFADGAWTPFGGHKELFQAGVVSEFTDHLGRVWFGATKSHLALLDGDRVRLFDSKDGIRIGNITAIYGRGAAIWMGGELGLQQVDNGQVRTVHAADDGFLQGISGVIETAGGDLWLNGLRGIFHVGPAELSKALKDSQYRVRGELFDSRMGVNGVTSQVRPLPSAIQANDGRLWFSRFQGVVWIDPNRAAKKPYRPVIAIQSVIVDGKDYAPVFPLTLPAHTSNLTIRYSAVSLSDPNAVRIRFQLHGADTGWSETTPGNPASYRNLSHGNYTFSIEASDTDGVWSDNVATVAFRILPAWYQTTLFRVSCAALAVMILWGLYRYRLHQMAHEYDLRMEERVAERTRIARELHDTLLQTFHGLMLRLQLVHQLLPEGKAKEQLELTRDRASQAIAEGRSAVYGLRANVMSVEDLADAVRALGEELATDGTVFRLEVDGEPQILHPLIRDELYRIMREALRNAFAHARASHVETEITYAGRSLQLRIRDDGVGIAPEILEKGREGHFGLEGIRERARRIGAKLSIWSRAGTGTEIELRLAGSIAYGSRRPSERRMFARKRVDA